jgi:hypothetical protein
MWYSSKLNHCGPNRSLNIAVQILMTESQLKKVFRVIPLRLKRVGLFCIVSFCLIMLEDTLLFCTIFKAFAEPAVTLLPC